jgi:hypothetical protein
MKQTKTWLSPNDRGDLVTLQAIVDQGALIGYVQTPVIATIGVWSYGPGTALCSST